MAESEQIKSRRDQFGERLKTKYPDREYADDEALFGQINDDYDEYENELTGAREREQKLVDTFNNNPHAAHFLTDMVKGNNPWCGLIERIGIDGMTDLMNDPEKREEFAESQKKFMERVAREKELEEEYNANLTQSLDTFARLQQERGLTDDDIDQAVDMLKQICNEVLLGKFTEGSIDLALKALNHDADIEAAAQEGEVRGRNTKIEEHLRKPKAGDGIPNLGGSNATRSTEAPQRQSIFDMARGAR